MVGCGERRELDDRVGHTWRAALSFPKRKTEQRKKEKDKRFGGRRKGEKKHQNLTQNSHISGLSEKAAFGRQRMTFQGSN